MAEAICRNGEALKISAALDLDGELVFIIFHHGSHHSGGSEEPPQSNGCYGAGVVNGSGVFR